MPMRTIIIFLAAVGLGGMAGCTYESSSTTKPSSWTQQAIDDPYNFNNPKMEKPNISGGDIGNFDKEGFKKDWDHVFNP
jgi:hypothetical protein